MKRNTRSEILQTAKRLFNEQGFNVISIRDIAAAMGISSGNLTYYFKRKEAIVEALVAESTDTKPAKAPQSLAELNAFFLDMQTAVKENAFYFWHHAQLSQLSPEIREKQKARYGQNVKQLREAFDSLEAAGLMRAEELVGEYARVIDTLLVTSIYWIPFSELKGAEAGQTTYQRQAWSILQQLLTAEGRRQAANLM